VITCSGNGSGEALLLEGFGKRGVPLLKADFEAIKRRGNQAYRQGER